MSEPKFRPYQHITTTLFTIQFSYQAHCWFDVHFIFLPDILGIKKKWEHNKKHDDTFNDDDEWCVWWEWIISFCCTKMLLFWFVVTWLLKMQKRKEFWMLEIEVIMIMHFYCLHACRQIKIKHKSNHHTTTTTPTSLPPPPRHNNPWWLVLCVRSFSSPENYKFFSN